MHSIRPSRTLFVLAGLLVVATQVGAQTNWAVDRKLSLAWWQVSPHLNHLWATTCPQEPTWRPGEGRSGGWVVKDAPQTKSKTGWQNVGDTINVPLYPRGEVTPVCTEAVEGLVVVADTVTWRVLGGNVAVKGNALVTGEDRRDNYAKRAILQTDRYPDIVFKIDSVVGTRKDGDTLRTTAVGQFTLHGVTKPMNAQVVAFSEAGGVRVLGKFMVPVKDLVPVWGLSKFALGLGVGTKIWEHLFMGVDLVLRPQTAAGGN
jgi:hypothetical protein